MDLRYEKYDFVKKKKKGKILSIKFFNRFVELFKVKLQVFINNFKSVNVTFHDALCF